MAAYDPIQVRFDAVIREFKSKLGDDGLYDEIRNFRSAEDVYEATDKLQMEQGRNGHLRHLSKIGPFLERMQDYSEVIKTFIQVKPDILALIWGPIRLLLQWASVLKQSFDAIINATAEIGDLLPEFLEVSKLFDQNAQLKDVLVLFFQDILDFYLVALQFFGKSRWRYVFEALWPRQRDRINLVMTHLKRHASLMRNEVRLEHIREEHQARLEAMAHFEKSEKANIRQEHEVIRNAISPRSYNDKLNWYHGRVCEGTSQWLMSDPIFAKWLDYNDDSTRSLWLKGIPGSGKTFLAGAAIDKVKLSGRTAFAFLSHAYAGDTTALSVLHSLTFQLTFDDLDLQAVLCQCNEENLGSNVGVATNVLSTLLSSLDKAYIVIDGLDEIDRIERGRLLSQMVEISKACVKVRILITSRTESDILAKLDRCFTSIQVNDHNGGSIQAFVTQKTQNFLESRDFQANERTEIEALLAPVGSKAKGMFLYAKVLLDCIELLYDIDSIRDELQVLPEDLHVAYHRILTRINSLRSPVARRTARQVIGWIGCSPTPLTIREIEQALVVGLDSDPTLASVKASLNIVELCGPIVEVEDGYARFVHFTVKEYVFGKDINGHIDLIDATFELTNRCIYYLCKEHLSHWLDTNEIEHHLLLGSYRLAYYALRYWFELVLQSIALSSNTLPQSIIHALELLISRRSNFDFGAFPVRLHEVNRAHLNALEPKHTRTTEMLRYVDHYNQQISGSAVHLRDIENWKWPAPLVVSPVLKRVHELVDRIPCRNNNHVEDCSCAVIQHHYGSNLFKCGYIECPEFRKGFFKRSLRKSHEKLHAKPWKCTEPGCEYANIGFLSQRMRDKHSDLHRQTQVQPSGLPFHFSDGNEESFYALLVDLIRLDKTSEIKALLPNIEDLPNERKYRLFKVTAAYGSSAMSKLLFCDLPCAAKYMFLNFLYCSAANGNIESLRVIKSRIPRVTSYRIILQALFVSNDSEVRQECEKMWFDKSLHSSRICDLAMSDVFICGSYDLAMLRAAFHIKVLKELRGRRDNEDWLAAVWTELAAKYGRSREMTRSMIGRSFFFVVTSLASVALAKILVGYVATVDYRPTKRSLTPLQQVARGTGERNAKMMEFLLYHGADPEPRVDCAERAISEERGAKHIANWLNISWEQLVEKVKSDRAQGYCPPEYRSDFNTPLDGAHEAWSPTSSHTSESSE